VYVLDCIVTAANGKVGISGSRSSPCENKTFLLAKQGGPRDNIRIQLVHVVNNFKFPPYSASEHRPMAMRETTRRFRWESTIPLPRHRANTVFPPRTPLRVKYATWMGRPSPHATPAQARPRMVADSARPAQRTFNLQTDRDGLPTRRLKWLRMKSRVKRQPQISGARFHVRRRPAPTHHMEGATSRTTRDRVCSTSATGTQRLTTRGQHRRRGYAFQANHSLPRHDDRI
jgi:hypothetical protein